MSPITSSTDMNPPLPQIKRREDSGTTVQSPDPDRATTSTQDVKATPSEVKTPADTTTRVVFRPSRAHQCGARKGWAPQSNAQNQTER